jgi:hypothetical protein
MNACESENYLAISRSSSASKSVEIFWAEIYRGRLFLGPNLVSFKYVFFPISVPILMCLFVRRGDNRNLSANKQK